MRLYDGLGDADERRAADLVDVHRLLHYTEVFLQNGSGKLVLRALIEHALERLHHVLDDALGALEKHITGEAVSHDDVCRAVKHSRALNIADEVYPALFIRVFQQGKGLML